MTRTKCLFFIEKTRLKQGLFILILLPVVTASAMAETRILASSTVVTAPSEPVTRYVGREKPEPHRHYRIISQSAGYGVDPRFPPTRIDYRAPSTTTVYQHVQVIPPSAGVGDVYLNQDTYYLYPPAIGSRYPGRRYHPPVVPVTNDPQATEDRAKQWTDKSGFAP